MTTLALSAAQAGAVSNMESLAIDSLGHPRLRWTPPAGSFSYQVERQSDRSAAGETSCPGSGETLVAGWCRLGSVSTTPDGSSGNVIFTDNAIRVDPSDPTEYQYRVSTVSGGVTTSVAQWAANCEAVPSGDPLSDWASLRMRDLNDAPILDSLLTSDKNDLLNPPDNSVSMMILGNGMYYAIYDNRYIAVIGKYSGLVSLVHRNYGDDLITNYVSPDGTLIAKNPWTDSWKIMLHKQGEPETSDVPVESIGKDPVTITQLSNGWSFSWTNVDNKGLNVTVTWTLQQAGSPGLHGKIEVIPTNTGADRGIGRVEFPLVRGLGFPLADVHWPGSATGATYTTFPFRSVTDNEVWFPSADNPDGTRVVSGEYLDGLRMQFFGVSQNGISGTSSMYFAAEDPNQLPKSMRFWPHYIEAGVFRANASTVVHYPMNGTGEAQSSVGNNNDDYDVVLTPMCGGEERIAKRYRRFALQQDWVKAPASTTVGGSPTDSTRINAPTKVRNDLNQKVKEGVWWWLQDNGPENSLDYMADYAQDTLKPLIGPGSAGGEVDIGIHLYSWHTPSRDNNMPQFRQRAPYSASEPVQNMTDYLSTVQDEHTVVMPYINAMLVDITDRCLPTGEDPYCTYVDAEKCDDGSGTRVCGWFNHYFLPGYYTRHFLLYNDQGASVNTAMYIYKFADEDAPPSATDAPADISSTFWQAVTDQNAGTVFGFGATGLYLDSFGIGYRPDYASFWTIPRSRPTGHGDFYREGSIALAGIARAKGIEQQQLEQQTDPQQVVEKRFIAAEHFNEAYVRSVDLFTIYDEHGMEAAPLSQLVYSDYVLFAGPRAREKDTPTARAMRYGRAFTWGVQPGLTGIGGICDTDGNIHCTDGLNGRNPALLGYLKVLAKARNKLHEFLSLGEFFGMVDGSGTLLQPGAPGQTESGWCVDQGCKKVENDPAPAIRAARWVSSAQVKAIIMTNTSFAPATTTLTVPANWRGLSIQCKDENHAGDSSCISGTTAATTLPVSMPALSVRYITFN